MGQAHAKQSWAIRYAWVDRDNTGYRSARLASQLSPSSLLDRLRLQLGCQHKSEKLEHRRVGEIWFAPIPISLGQAQNLRPDPAGGVAAAAVIGANDCLVSYL